MIHGLFSFRKVFMFYDKELLSIQGFIDLYFEEMFSDDRYYDFDTYAYSNWAADEIIRRIIQEDDRLPPHISGKELTPVDHIIEGFVLDMECASLETEIPQKKFIFDTASDVGKIILYSFRKETTNEKRK